MLSLKHLDSIQTFFDESISKLQKKITTESNPKVVNYKIRAFIEKLKDQLTDLESAESANAPISKIEETQPEQVKDKTEIKNEEVLEPQVGDKRDRD